MVGSLEVGRLITQASKRAASDGFRQKNVLPLQACQTAAQHTFVLLKPSCYVKNAVDTIQLS